MASAARTSSHRAAINSAPFNQVEKLCPRSNAATFPASRTAFKYGINQNHAHNTAARTSNITIIEMLCPRSKYPNAAKDALAATNP